MFAERRFPMARTRAFLLITVVLFSLSTCKALFDFNAFSSLDKASVPDPARYQGVGGLSNLQNDLSSPAVVAALSGDPATVAAILSNLDTTYHVTTGPLTTPEQQTAAILYAQLALATTSGDVLINNIIASVLTNAPGNLASIMQSIVPADVAADLTKFTAMMNGLLTANAAYQVLGASVPPAPPGMNIGDVAQKAAVAYLMERVYAAVVITVGAPNAMTEMFALLNNQPNSISSITTTPANPLNPLPGWLKNLFDAAGAQYPA
jgi:hypothetical protein